MKKANPIFLSSIFIFMLIAIASCNKRDEYLGNYNCNYQQNCWGNTSPCNLADGGLEVIVIQAGSRENTVTIFGQEVEINSFGRGSYGNHDVSGFDVSFNNGMLNVYQYYAPAYGGYTRTYMGSRGQ